jgi:hypothetical protein
MENTENKLVEDFNLKFDGNLHEVKVDTFLRSLSGVNDIVTEINQQINTEFSQNNKIELKITANKPGSFEAALQIIQSTGELLFDVKNVPYAAGIVTILTGLLKFRQFLSRSKKTKKEELPDKKFKVENENGDVFIIENLTYNIHEKSHNIKNSISRTFEALESDNDIKSFNVTSTTGENLFTSSRDDFSGLTEFEEPSITDDEKIISEFARLVVQKVVFEKKYKWTFYHRGNKITASIEDDDFYSRINEGETFGKGDILEVDLKIHKKYQKDLNTFINEKYVVTKVLNHIPRTDQTELFE